MPWLPDLANAAELARQSRREAGQTDPVGQYLTALSSGDVGDLEDVWPGEVMVHDPHAGEIRGHRRLREFVRNSRQMLAERDAHVQRGPTIVIGGRAVMELIVHLTVDGREIDWPVAVVAESPDEWSVAFRTYCNQRVVYGGKYIRSPILGSGSAHPGDIVGRHLAALDAGDVAATVSSFDPGGYLREPDGATFRGTAELRDHFQDCLGDGGISFENCAITDDGVRCAVEYNCVRWGGQVVKPQAGMTVYERGGDGLLAAARVYDDIEAPPRTIRTGR